MVMEYINGACLDAIIKERDHLPVPEALECFIPICDAMAHAHANRILHRDLKPSNIMVSPKSDHDSLIKVVDFGCGKLRDLNGKQASALTQEGRSLGTPSFMSPEQVLGKPLDDRTDIYSLGCVLYVTLTGYVLHLGDNAAQTMQMHLVNDVPLLREMNPDLSYPDALEKSIAKALAREADNRYQSMLEFKTDLEQILIAVPQQ
jgi:serine/threonine-protein kinase